MDADSRSRSKSSPAKKASSPSKLTSRKISVRKERKDKKAKSSNSDTPPQTSSPAPQAQASRDVSGLSFLEMLREGSFSTTESEEGTVPVNTETLEPSESNSSLTETTSPRTARLTEKPLQAPRPEPQTRGEFIERIKELQEKKARLVHEANDINSRLAEIKKEGGTLKEILFNVAMLAPPPKTGASGVDVKKLIRTSNPPIMQKDRKDLTQREKVIIEIMTSEQVYLTGLRIMKEAYLAPMREKAEKSKHIDERVVDEIFCNIELLHLINDGLCTILEKTLETWGQPGAEENLGEILLDQGSKLKGPYCRFGAEYEKGAKTLASQLANNSEWKQAWEQLDEHVFSVTKLHFNDYYITPVQRVPRYGLLIRDLLKATPVTHPDYKKLRDAGERMEAIASDINLKIRESETTTHFAALLSRGSAFARLKTDPPCYGKSRVWQKDGSILSVFDLLDVKRTYVSKKDKELILFNDILVASPFLNKKVPIQDCTTPTKVMWLSATLSAADKEKLGEEAETTYKLSLKIQGPEAHWIVAFRSIADKTQWQNALIAQMGMNVTGIADSGTGARKGIYKFRSGSVYDGVWSEGCPDGLGTMDTPDRVSWEGYWNQKYLCGVGEMDGTYTGWKFTKTGEVTQEDPYNLWSALETPTDRDWQLIMSNAKTTTVEKGELLIEQGKKNTRLIKLLKGELAIEKILKDGEPPVQVAILDKEGTILGETSVIQTIGQATASVRAHTQVTIQEIDVSLLVSIFATEPGISLRFFRWIARQLATKLRSLDVKPGQQPQQQQQPTPQPEPEESSETTESRDEEGIKAQKTLRHTNSSSANVPLNMRSTSTTAKLSSKDKKKGQGQGQGQAQQAQVAAQADEDAHVKFGIDSKEPLFKQASCTLKAMLKKIGTLYLFREHVVFSSTVFGMNHTEVIPLYLVTDIELEEEKDTMKIEMKGKKFQFVYVTTNTPGKSTSEPKKENTIGPHELWEEARVQEGEAGEKLGGKERRALRKKESLRGTAKTPMKITDSSKQAQKNQIEETTIDSITFSEADWALIAEGAELLECLPGDIIIQEGQKHHRIYQIASGTCDVVVDKEEGRKHLITLSQGSLLGEMTFLDPANQKATASVIAGKDGCGVYLIEGAYINMLMVYNPHLAGRFYSYLCSILAKRHSDREMQRK